MVQFETKSTRQIARKTIELGQCVFAASIRPVRSINGRKSAAYTWDVILREPQRARVGCGTALTKNEAEEQIDLALVAFATLPRRKHARKRLDRLVLQQSLQRHAALSRSAAK